jgi:hypothetical protein
MHSPNVLSYTEPLIANPLHVFEENLLTPAVIEFRGPVVRLSGVAGDSLSGFKSAVVLEKIRDTGRAK